MGLRGVCRRVVGTDGVRRMFMSSSGLWRGERHIVLELAVTSATQRVLFLVMSLFLHVDDSVN